ncbi:autotransporter-associated beta strand repeat-containing protein [Streptomyces sp. NPDC102360]|uniref:autotransporter-associated beta strand repeat-containing protein n=1 Tax=Streptomyces sp. NPDC102360 TaxID=3366160 RepID=UPI0038289691
MPKEQVTDQSMTVPRAAEVLLETRLPYLTADQRREVLRTTALPAGYALLDEGFEQWGRLNLFAAADGYGMFDTDVEVTVDAAAGGFAAADAWRGDIGGPGALTKRGTGTLTLTGANHHTGGTTLEAGVLTTGSRNTLGRGDVSVRGGTLRVAAPLRVHGVHGQGAGTTLAVTVSDDGEPAVSVAHRALVSADGNTLAVTLDTEHPPTPGSTAPARPRPSWPTTSSRHAP